ncbi:unnamed protein product [Parnassius apollo]|uniref:(apollo) hypothetical protein n=2 Tax=Parnassius apollo TaxID=110799 RepID=A0A8S3WCJ9_PARAO|nr:unnamed protein product [Parnassius apollo]
MNVHRSPTGSDTISARCGSYPDLASKIMCQDKTESSQITFRNKRKLENENDDLKNEFAEMRKQMTSMQNQMSEMMTYLTTTTNMQVENFKKINEDVSTIKQQISDIKLTTEILTEEQTKLKIEVENLKKISNITEKKIESIQSNLLLQDTTPSCSSSVLNAQEEIVAELNERTIRSKNIIIAGVPESKSTNLNARYEEDKTAVLKIINTVLPGGFTEPQKIYRLGKYQSDIVITYEFLCSHDK